MKVLVAILAIAALVYAEEDLDWSTVKPKDIRIPWPVGAELTPILKQFYDNSRIVGGTEAAPNSIPYQAALLLTAAAGTFFCGGSLISTRYVLTAAHCLDGVVQVEVRLGAHQVNVNEASQVRLFTSTFVQHSAWNAANLQNDIAVIELPQAVTLSASIQILPLPTYSDVGNNFSGTSARISGWGLDSDSSTAISPVLRQVFADVISNFLCNIQFLGIIQNTHICTSGTGGRGACSGDSGGPLVVGNRQIGIVSFGLALGCEIGWPSAFTRVTSYLDWIAANTDVTISP
uniref:Serine protease 13 n=1 Tax=Costelytra zealandica TaxID=50579 RepID=B0ZBP1_9SCAR|nr:serine protease 13 [Costelytra zealandica]